MTTRRLFRGRTSPSVAQQQRRQLVRGGQRRLQQLQQRQRQRRQQGRQRRLQTSAVEDARRRTLPTPSTTWLPGNRRRPRRRHRHGLSDSNGTSFFFREATSPQCSAAVVLQHGGRRRVLLAGDCVQARTTRAFCRKYTPSSAPSVEGLDACPRGSGPFSRQLQFLAGRAEVVDSCAWQQRLQAASFNFECARARAWKHNNKCPGCLLNDAGRDWRQRRIVVTFRRIKKAVFLVSSSERAPDAAAISVYFCFISGVRPRVV